MCQFAVKSIDMQPRHICSTQVMPKDGSSSRGVPKLVNQFVEALSSGQAGVKLSIQKDCLGASSFPCMSLVVFMKRPL